MDYDLNSVFPSPPSDAHTEHMPGAECAFYRVAAEE